MQADQSTWTSDRPDRGATPLDPDVEEFLYPESFSDDEISGDGLGLHRGAQDPGGRTDLTRSPVVQRYNYAAVADPIGFELSEQYPVYDEKSIEAPSVECEEQQPSEDDSKTRNGFEESLWREPSPGSRAAEERERILGFDQGMKRGRELGFEAGLEQGLRLGREQGREEGLNQGQSAGREDGRVRGFEEGTRHLEQERSRLHAQAASLIASFVIARDRCLQQLEKEAVELALAIAARILRREAQADPLLLTGSVRVALGQLATSTVVRLRVPAADHALWEEAIQHLPGLALRPQVIGDSALEPGECLMETEVGDANLGLWAQLKTIEKGFFECSDALELSPESLPEVEADFDRQNSFRPQGDGRHEETKDAQ